LRPRRTHRRASPCLPPPLLTRSAAPAQIIWKFDLGRLHADMAEDREDYLDDGEGGGGGDALMAEAVEELKETGGLVGGRGGGGGRCGRG
jgi:hypothetical protein